MINNSNEHNFNFRKVKRYELIQISKMYSDSIGLPFCTWNKDYPGYDEIINDYDNGNLYVLTLDSKIIGSISIVSNNELNEMDFWKNKNMHMEFSRVVIAPIHRLNGYSKLLINYIETEIKARGFNNIRILVAKKNVPAMRLYISLGYTVSGEIHLYDIDFYGMEKEIS